MPDLAKLTSCIRIDLSKQEVWVGNSHLSRALKDLTRHDTMWWDAVLGGFTESELKVLSTHVNRHQGYLEDQKKAHAAYVKASQRKLAESMKEHPVCRDANCRICLEHIQMLNDLGRIMSL